MRVTDNRPSEFSGSCRILVQSARAQLPKRPVKDKFETAALDSFDYSSFVFTGTQAGISQASDAYPEFHQGVMLYSNRFFRTFGAKIKQKSPAINSLHDLSNHTFTLFPKSIQVVDWRRLVRSFLFEAAPKVRKILNKVGEGLNGIGDAAVYIRTIEA